jgi:N6-adenosine-specific RNA methylase IME4
MSDTKRSAQSQYQTMTVEDICALGSHGTVAGFETAGDSVLFLWCTNPILIDGTAAKVARAWGFKPAQLITWVKVTADRGAEMWRQHPTFTEYEVSTHGRVKRSGRIVKWREWGPYPQVRLYRDGVETDVRVHVLVAETFLGPRPEGYEIDHLDSDKRNASLANLEYVTLKENRRRATELGVVGGPPKPESELSMTPKAVQTRVYRSKLQIGLGHITRSVTEHMMVCTRGKTKKLLFNKSTPNVIFAPRRRHSEKPQAAYDLIEQLTPGPYLDLFARKRREGWQGWGLEYPEAA